MKQISALSALVLFTSCSGAKVEVDTETEAQITAITDTGDCPASTMEDVSMDEQMPMVDRCNALHQNLRDSNIILHGGVRPGVEADTWDGLSELEQAKVLLSAACMQSAGIPGPQAVEVIEAGTENGLESKTVCVRDPLQTSD